jgi:hypothetical protein
MLNKDAEEILKVLIDLYKEVQSFELGGDYKIFPEGYQNGLSSIFEKLEQNGFIYNHKECIGGDFILSLSPSALTYFDDKDKTEKEKQTAQSITIHNFTATGSNVNLGTLSHSTMVTENAVSFIEKEIEEKGGVDKEELRDLLEEIKELCDNIQANKSLPKSKSLMNRISKHFETHGWFYGAIVQLIGTAAMQVMTGK